MVLKDLLSLIGIGLTFIISLISLIVSIRNSKKTSFINSVTSSRVKWIDALRDDVSEFCGLVTHYRITDEIDEENAREIYQKIDMLEFQIRLKLNRSSKLDKNMIEKLQSILDNLESKNDKADEEIEGLLLLTQDLLKFEWERVKKESKLGNLNSSQKKDLEVKYLDKNSTAN